MKKWQRIIVITVLILAIIGIAMIYSASSIWAEYKFNDAFHFAKYQSVFLVISLIFLIIVRRFKHQFLYQNANLILFISLILLILVLVPGIGSIRNGSRSWFAVGAIGIQPSEISKIALIIFTSKYLSKIKNNTLKEILPLLLIIFLFFLLILLEPDFGTGMVIVLSLIIMIFISGVKLSYFAYFGILGLLGIIGLIIIAPYRIARIVSFLNPWSDPLGSGFQIIQSLYAIGPGGLFGVGFGNSIQKQFYLPEPHTDFIFAIICEEFGIIGVIIICFLFYLFFKAVVKIALKKQNLFSKYLVIGLGFQIILQALLNLCVVVGLMPVTGVTLPFISYGGSSLFISMISIGIIISLD